MAARDQVSLIAASTAAVSVTIQFSANPAAGDTVLAWATTYGTPAATNPMRDNGATVTNFTLDRSQLTASPGIYLYRGQGITMPATGAYTLTYTNAASSFITAGAVAYTGVAAGAPVAVNGAGASTTAVSSGAVTNAAAGSLYFAAAGTNGSGTAPLTLTSAGWTAAVATGTQIPGASADIVSGTGSQTATWTIATAVAQNAAIATYASTAAPPTDPGPPLTAAYVGPA